MNELSLSTIQNGKWKMLEMDGKKQRLLNMKLINIVSRFRNLTILRLLIPDLIYSQLDFLFENCTKLIKLTICSHKAHFISEIQNIKANCKHIESIQLALQHEQTAICSQSLRNLCSLLPGVSVEVI